MKVFIQASCASKGDGVLGIAPFSLWARDVLILVVPGHAVLQPVLTGAASARLTRRSGNSSVNGSHPIVCCLRKRECSLAHQSIAGGDFDQCGCEPAHQDYGTVAPFKPRRRCASSGRPRTFTPVRNRPLQARGQSRSARPTPLEVNGFLGRIDQRRLASMCHTSPNGSHPHPKPQPVDRKFVGRIVGRRGDLGPDSRISRRNTYPKRPGKIGRHLRYARGRRNRQGIGHDYGRQHGVARTTVQGWYRGSIQQICPQPAGAACPRYVVL